MRRVLISALAAVSCFAADPGLVRFVPADAKTIAGIDIERSSATQFGQFILRRMQKEDAGFKDFIAATGFDPRRDVREVIVASVNPGPGKSGLLLVRGTFDIQRLVSVAKAKGANAMKVSGVDVITGAEAKGGWFALLDSSTGIAGDEKSVRAALDRRNATVSLDARTAGRINELSARYEAWMISSVPASMASHASDAETGKMMKGNMLQAVEQVSGGVKLGTNVVFEGEADTRSDKDAQALMDVVKFLAGMVQMNREQQPEAARLAAVLDSLQMQQHGDIVKLSVTVPEADLEKWIAEPVRKPVRSAAR